MTGVSTRCSQCLEPFTQAAESAEEGVTVCPQCRKDLDAFVQNLRSKINLNPDAQSSYPSCIADLESNMATLASRNDLTQWEVKRAHLILEIGQLLLDGRIDDNGFRNLLNALPVESSARWSLNGTQLLEAEGPKGEVPAGMPFGVSSTTYGPDGKPPTTLNMLLECVEPYQPSIKTQRPAPSGCLLLAVAVAVPLGFWIVRILT